MAAALLRGRRSHPPPPLKGQAMAAVFRCIAPFAYDTRDGVQHVVRHGDLIVEGSPALVGRATLFEQVGGDSAPATTVEDASAEPGAKRSRSRTRKTA